MRLRTECRTSRHPAQRIFGAPIRGIHGSGKETIALSGQNRKNAAHGSERRQPDGGLPPAPPPEPFTKAFRWMLLARTLDDKLPASTGQARSTAVSSWAVVMRRWPRRWSGLASGGRFTPRSSGSGRPVAFGEPVLDVVRTFMGSALVRCVVAMGMCIAAVHARASCR